MQVIRQSRIYDVCIVGSGAGGGMAAKVLCEAGADVVMLEAGGMWDVEKDSKMSAWAYDSPRRGAATPSRPFGEFDGCVGGWDLEGEPYTQAPGSTFDWFRARMLGGRTNHWGRISLRFGPDDFRRRSIDGLGDEWPITYDDLKPYYDKLDRLVGIFGSMENLPNEPNGVFLPPPKPRCYELLIKQSCDRLGITCIPARLSILTKPLNGRAACHYCGQCGRGCATHSNFSSPSVLLPPALATGRLRIIANAMAREVTTGEDGLATGVSYVDTNDRRDYAVRARIVVLAASACETARLLLNSKSARFPDGLANSSGTVGRYLTDSTGLTVSGHIPKLADGVPHNEDGVGGMHLYMPWWLDNAKLDFPRGYHVEISGGRRGAPSYGILGGIQRFNGRGGYGKQLKDDYRKYYGSTVSFSGRGEMLPNDQTYCEIDPFAVDTYGIPVLRFHASFTDHEYRQAKHMQETFREIIHDMGGTPLSPMPSRDAWYGLENVGRIIHEVGTTRMGNDPKTSVVDANCQAHDVKNLFIADGGPFVSNADKNVTWTILALSMRTSERIAQQRNQGIL
ncbi:MAG: GMC family oxidoreductase [Acidobacteria bacterium]|nr:MAG: GMC family oxidoreductase [Acidobacteriota bacterium]PYQ85678.1 MAG: GMC family oxidoreductase [Acidobacteriota bacterium]PYR08068.1 MAG: GMC family oxidoreductase [Acidobacteriota bacterium]